MSKKTNIGEDTTTTGDGNVAGLGFNTGNPAVSDDELRSYAGVNSLSSDSINGYLSKLLQSNQNKLSQRIGFKAFDPSKDLRKR